MRPGDPGLGLEHFCRPMDDSFRMRLFLRLLQQWAKFSFTIKKESEDPLKLSENFFSQIRFSRALTLSELLGKLV